MKIFISNIVLLAKRLLFLMALYTLCRIYFLLCNFPSFQPIELKGIAASFFYGLRFDFAALFFLNVIFYPFHFLAFQFVKNQTYQKILRQVVIVVNAFGLLLNIIDTGYFGFQNCRSGADFITNILFSEDTANLLPQYICDYWYHLLVFIGFVLILEKWLPRYKSLNIEKQKFEILKCTLLALLISAGSFCLYRGFEVKPLSVIDAAKFATTKYSSLTLNTPFTIVRTIGKNGIPHRSYFDDETAKTLYSAQHQYQFSDEEFSRKNVVILLLEGFSQRSIGALHTREKGYTPFLDSIISKSYSFSNAFANGTKSIQALPSILSSIPQLCDETIIGSRYASNKVDALPLLLKNEGYQTAFFHGAYNGSMGFDKYCETVGIDYYFGMDEYLKSFPKKGNFDGDWGIFDDRFLNYTKNQLDSFSQPFFATIFTISSHHPYTLPDEFVNSFKEKRPELNALRYADASLQLFFENAQKSSWYNNTIFVFVADHTVPYAFDPDITQEYISPVDRRRIPLIFYMPSDTTFKAKDNKIVQQIDILPSILYQLHYNKPFIAFGENVFNDTTARAIYYNSGTYTYIDSASVVEFDGETVSNCYKILENSIQKTSVSDNQLNHLKAFLQNYSQRMNFNQTSFSK